ncbi:hypothetical protein BBF96_10945 [Anoxybacter fermentans]|uniref:Uncharacterized protein n=1 Tax=Anoxybacter fermentans TaxID=1323375 RepID=A0A3Q9HR26_9FIRM|nr:MinD/ParA family protein [Anoxybacter fermentans]AZR73858.1 hypothetical protein BBF96_10945 [Anoxybacter fermentans]
MRDQAERLRQLAKKNIDDLSRSETRVIAVASGKGGVGKTNFTVNLALALQKAGKKIIVFDADLGMANIDVVLGVVPSFTLTHVIKGQKTLEEIMLDGPEGIKILPGSSGSEELVYLSDQQIQNLIRQWNNLEGEFDYILVDTGAGIHSNVINFLLAADDVVVILTPEPPSITDSYGLIKVLVQRGSTSTIRLVINQVSNEEEGRKIFRRVAKVVDEFLNVKIDLLGIITFDEKVSAAVKRQKPFILEYPNTKASKGIYSIVDNLLNQSPKKAGGGMKKFLLKMIKFFNSSS